MWCLAHSRHSVFKTQSKTKVPSDGLKAEGIPPCSEGGGGGGGVPQTHSAHSLHVPRGAEDPGGHPVIPQETESWMSGLPSRPQVLICSVTWSQAPLFPLLGRGGREKGGSCVLKK